jgi:hypothetical protein
VGQRVSEYVVQLVSFAVLGYFMVYGLGMLNTWLNNSLLEILADGVLGLALLLLGSYWLLNRKTDGNRLDVPAAVRS